MSSRRRILQQTIYEGSYDPASRLADTSGFRRDVMDEIRKPGVRTP